MYGELYVRERIYGECFRVGIGTSVGIGIGIGDGIGAGSCAIRIKFIESGAGIVTDPVPRIYSLGREVGCAAPQGEFFGIGGGC